MVQLTVPGMSAIISSGEIICIFSLATMLNG